MKNIIILKVNTNVDIHDIPERPREKVGIDLMKLHKTTAESVIGKLKHHHGGYGIPDIIVNDNGPPFSSQDFDDFTRQ